MSPLGDIATPIKRSLTGAESETLKQIEHAILRIFSTIYPKIGRIIHAYESNPHATVNQIVKLADILDALFITVDERRTNNRVFEELVRSQEFVTYLTSVEQAYAQIARTIGLDFPAVLSFVRDPHPIGEHERSRLPEVYRVWQDIGDETPHNFDPGYPQFNETINNELKYLIPFYKKILAPIHQWEEDIGDMVVLMQESGLPVGILKDIIFQGDKSPYLYLTEIQQINNGVIRAIFSVKGVRYSQELKLSISDNSDSVSISHYSKLIPLN